MKATHFPGLREATVDGQPAVPGSYEFANGHMWFMCPGPCKQLSALHLDGKGGEGRNWTWDGNTEAPTLHPSIHHLGCWHGWLKNGEFTPA